ncbi:MAG TPA: DNA glycosylase, partial [Acidimicrobiaceae bacterium]|nr:DNA glycosylase [Acidimicrobiaceae bacterium]
MPEGHTTHRLARDIAGDLRGRRTAASSPQGRAAAAASSVDGRVLAQTEAYGKHLALRFDGATAGPTIIHVHLGLIGRFARVPAETAERDTIRLRLRDAGGAPGAPA